MSNSTSTSFFTFKWERSFQSIYFCAIIFTSKVSILCKPKYPIQYQREGNILSKCYRIQLMPYYSVQFITLHIKLFEINVKVRWSIPVPNLLWQSLPILRPVNFLQWNCHQNIWLIVLKQALRLPLKPIGRCSENQDHYDDMAQCPARNI